MCVISTEFGIPSTERGDGLSTGSGSATKDKQFAITFIVRKHVSSTEIDVPSTKFDNPST